MSQIPYVREPSKKFLFFKFEGLYLLILTYPYLWHNLKTLLSQFTINFGGLQAGCCLNPEPVMVTCSVLRTKPQSSKIGYSLIDWKIKAKIVCLPEKEKLVLTTVTPWVLLPKQFYICSYNCCQQFSFDGLFE